MASDELYYGQLQVWRAVTVTEQEHQQFVQGGHYFLNIQGSHLIQQFRFKPASQYLIYNANTEGKPGGLSIFVLVKKVSALSVEEF